MARAAARRAHTIEFRHQSWFAPEVMDALRAHGVALTIGDHPERPFQILRGDGVVAVHPLSLRVARARRQLLGDGDRRRGRERIAAGAGAEDVYAYFNNDWQGFAPANARTLLLRLQSPRH